MLWTSQEGLFDARRRHVSRFYHWNCRSQDIIVYRCRVLYCQISQCIFVTDGTFLMPAEGTIARSKSANHKNQRTTTWATALWPHSLVQYAFLSFVANVVWVVHFWQVWPPQQIEHTTAKHFRALMQIIFIYLCQGAHRLTMYHLDSIWITLQLAHLIYRR